MGEIDDNYQESVEAAENFFFEDLKKGKNRKKVLERYHKNLENARKKFQKTYEKKLRKDKILASKLKEKKEKKEKYKHLEVGHFDFEFNAWQRFWMSFKVRWFNIGRFFRKTFSSIIPSIIMYFHYKFWITSKSFLREAVRKKDRIWRNFKHFIIKFSHDSWKNIVTLYHYLVKKIKWIFSKIIFWKKEEIKKEGEEGEEKNKEGATKKTEEKNEGEKESS